MAYWELRQRVGPLYAVRQPHVDVFSDLPLASGLCLAQLQDSAAADPGVARARRKIGAGLVLSREPPPDATVWLYNRSRYPIFVGGRSGGGASAVDRLAPGHCLRVMGDPAGDTGHCVEGLRSVQVSFGKGFGTDRYSRRTIHSCPCWIEILLRVT